MNTYTRDAWGCVEVFDGSGTSVLFMQGDEAEDLLLTLDRAEAASLNGGVLRSVFRSNEEVVSAILDDYLPEPQL